MHLRVVKFTTDISNFFQWKKPSSVQLSNPAAEQKTFCVPFMSTRGPETSEITRKVIDLSGGQLENYIDAIESH